MILKAAYSVCVYGSSALKLKLELFHKRICVFYLEDNTKSNALFNILKEEQVRFYCRQLHSFYTY